MDSKEKDIIAPMFSLKLVHMWCTQVSDAIDRFFSSSSSFFPSRALISTDEMLRSKGLRSKGVLKPYLDGVFIIFFFIFPLLGSSVPMKCSEMGLRGTGGLKSQVQVLKPWNSRK